ncbi:hypothetical protein LLH00_13300 [bacterium]|nr:hypothetical protein [bacterium]
MISLPGRILPAEQGIITPWGENNFPPAVCRMNMAPADSSEILDCSSENETGTPEDAAGFLGSAARKMCIPAGCPAFIGPRSSWLKEKKN